MTWVQFTQDFDFKPTPTAIIAYRPGIYNVTRSAARAAVAAGKAIHVESPKTRTDAVKHGEKN